MELFFLILIGLLVGFVGGFAGIGGAPFLVAYLVLVLGYPQLAAQGNVLTVMLGPMSLMGVISLWPEIKKLLSSIMIGVFTYAIFSYFGAEAAFRLGETNMKNFFAILLIIIAIIQFIPRIFSQTTDEDSLKESISIWWVLFLGSLIGFTGGLFGIGAGVLLVPIFINFFKLKKNYARGLSLAILLPPVSLGGFVRYNAENLIEWDLVLILFFSYFFANYFGAKLGSKVSSSFFQIAYAAILLAIAGIYLFL